MREEKRHGNYEWMQRYSAHFTDEETEADTSSQCPLGISHSPSVLDPGWNPGLVGRLDQRTHTAFHLGAPERIHQVVSPTPSLYAHNSKTLSFSKSNVMACYFQDRGWEHLKYSPAFPFWRQAWPAHCMDNVKVNARKDPVLTWLRAGIVTDWVRCYT